MRTPTSVRLGGGPTSFTGGGFTSSVAFWRLGSNRSLLTMVVTSTAGCCSTFSGTPRLPPRRVAPPPLPSALPSALGGESLRRSTTSTGGNARRHVQAICHPSSSTMSTRTLLRIAQRPIYYSCPCGGAGTVAGGTGCGGVAGTGLAVAGGFPGVAPPGRVTRGGKVGMLVGPPGTLTPNGG